MPKPPSHVTKSDLKVLRTDLGRDLSLLRGELKEDQRRTVGLVEAKMHKLFDSYRDEVLTRFDGIMRELETIKEENTLGVHQASELWEKADNHEKRIVKLEST